jgi:Transposase IS66 family
MILVEKYANHRPLNPQSEQYAREGIELSVSIMADHVGACAAAPLSLYELIKAHVFAAERIHGDETTVPVLAKVKPEPVACGLMYVTINRLPGLIRQPRCTIYSPDRRDSARFCTAADTNLIQTRGLNLKSEGRLPPPSPSEPASLVPPRPTNLRPSLLGQPPCNDARAAPAGSRRFRRTDF